MTTLFFQNIFGYIFSACKDGVDHHSGTLLFNRVQNNIVS